MKQKTKFKQTEIGMIPEDWEVKNITQLGEVITGKTPKTENKDNFGQEYPFITPRDMKGQKHIFKTERYLSEKGKNSVKNCLIPKNSVCVSCIGSDMGKLIMTTTESVTNQQINSIVPNISADFIYYAVLNVSPNIKNLGKQSTALPILNKSQFSKIEVAIPLDINETEKIAKILSDLDSKIELNQHMNKTLEAIGQAIFKRWFVNFEFPDERGKPYKSSGGEMVDSELGELPKGWKVCRLRDAVSYYIGGGWGKEQEFKDSVEAYVIRGTDIPSIRIGDTSNVPLRYHNSSNYQSRELKEEDIILELSGGSKGQPVGRNALISHLLLQSLKNKVICASFCKLIRVNQNFSPYYLFIFIDRTYNSEEIMKYQLQSTGISNFNFEFFLDDVKILIFPDEIRTKFDKILHSLFNKMNLAGTESSNLSQIRDSLLPKLMSGKIRVPVDAKIYR